MAERPKPLPLVDPDSKPFWDGCARGALMLQVCSACGAYRHPPAAICHACLSPEHEWREASGHATIYSFVVVRQALDRGWVNDLPYVVAIVELAEGPHMVTNIVDIPPDQVAVGMPVRVCFEQASEEIFLPKFRP